MALAAGLALIVLLLPAAGWIARLAFPSYQGEHALILGAVCITLAGIPAVILRLVFEGSLVGLERMDLTSMIRILINTLKAVLSILAALIWHSLLAVIGVTVLVSYLAVLLLYHYCRREMPGHAWILPAWQKDSLHKILRLGGLATLCFVFGYLFLYADRIIILSVLTLTLLGFYTGSFDLAIRETILANNISQSFLPVFSARAQDPVALGGSYFEASRLNAIASTGPGFLLAAFAYPILALLIGPGFAQHASSSLMLLSLGVLCMCYMNIPYTLIFAAMEKPQIYVGLYFLGIVLHVGISFLLVSRYGIAGVAAGFLTGYTAVWLASLAYVSSKLHQGIFSLLSRAFLPSWLVAVPLSLLGIYLQHIWHPAPLVSLIVLFVLISLYYLAMLAVGYSRAERSYMFGVLRRILKSAA